MRNVSDDLDVTGTRSNVGTRGHAWNAAARQSNSLPQRSSGTVLPASRGQARSYHMDNGYWQDGYYVSVPS